MKAPDPRMLEGYIVYVAYAVEGEQDSRLTPPVYLESYEPTTRTAVFRRRGNSSTETRTAVAVFDAGPDQQHG